MTREELNEVRDLVKSRRELEKEISELRMLVENIVPVLDGLPHATEIRSKVEILTVKIIDQSRELDRLHHEILQAKTRLTKKILTDIDDPAIQTLLVLRYVECLSYRETAQRMRFSLRYIFKLHAKFFEQFT